MTPQRVTLITLGVADLAAARAFYARLGWQEHIESQETVVFFQMHGAVLGLFPLAELAEKTTENFYRLFTKAKQYLPN